MEISPLLPTPAKIFLATPLENPLFTPPWKKTSDSHGHITWQVLIERLVHAFHNEEKQTMQSISRIY